MAIARYKKKNGKYSSMWCKDHRVKWLIETQYKLYHEFGVWMPYAKWKSWYQATRKA